MTELTVAPSAPSSVALCERVDLLPGVGQDAFIDIDSLLRPV